MSDAIVRDGRGDMRRAGMGGVILCAIYFLLFAGFVLLFLFEPTAMGKTEIELGGDWTLMLFGSDGAVAYGMLVIFGGMFLSLLYARL